MSAFDKYPLGKPAFVTHTLDRAAHFRTNDEKLFALEGQSNARAYVVYRDSLVMKQEESGPRALLSIKEALELRRQSRHDLPRACATARRFSAWAFRRPPPKN